MKQLIYGVLAAILFLVPMQGAQAQLVNVDKNYTIKNVDTVHNRLAVKYLDAANQPVKEQLLVDIDGNTTVMMNNHPMSWKSLRPGWQIQVKGGLETGLHIKAKTIIVRKTS